MLPEDIDNHEIAEACDELVKEGKLAKIIPQPGHPSYINADQVVIKCNHCGKLTNQPKWSLFAPVNNAIVTTIAGKSCTATVQNMEEIEMVEVTLKFDMSKPEDKGLMKHLTEAMEKLQDE